MPNFEIVRESGIDKKSFRVASVIGQFDLQVEKITERFKGNFELEDLDWQIGVIFGSSGSGKTTIAKELFGEEYFSIPDFSAASVVDDMPSECSATDITKMFTSVGFGSVPSWLKPYSVLSNGEKMRVDLAYSLLSDQHMVVFDEFTSVVDRQVACMGSLCIQRKIRKTNKKFIAVSCHEDIIEWLEPDWVFDTNAMEFCKLKKKDRKSKSKFMKPQKKYGKYLKSITI